MKQNGSIPSHFIEVFPHEVCPVVRHVAEQTLMVVCEDLQLSNVSVRWFRVVKRRGEQDQAARYVSKLEGRPRGIWGRVFAHAPREMWVRSTLSPLGAAETIVHEARHLWQLKKETLVDDPVMFKAQLRRLEADALEYTCRVVPLRVAVVGAPPGSLELVQAPGGG